MLASGVALPLSNKGARLNTSSVSIQNFKSSAFWNLTDLKNFMSYNCSCRMSKRSFDKDENTAMLFIMI